MAKFDDAVAVLLMGQPFFGTLLMKMEHIESTAIPTLCVNRKQLIYNPEFLDKLDLEEAVFCVGHEVMHQAWMHLPRLEHYLKSGIGPDGQPLDAQLFNQALDYPINHALVVGKVGKPVDPAKFQICLDPQRFPETMVPEDVYCLLKKNPKNGKGNALDEHDAMSFDQDPGAITPADIIQAAQQHKMIRGEYPAGIERLMNTLRKPEVSPWKRLRQFVTKNMPGYDATTWKRLQRRLITRGIGFPGRTAHGSGVVGIVVDTSGSIGDEMLQLFGGHMAAIIADARPESIRVYWTDAQVHRVDVVKNDSQLRQLLQKSVPGGGGTDMPEGVRAAEADKCNSIVVLTDGYTPFCSSDKPLMWAITSHNVTANSGVTIHI